MDPNINQQQVQSQSQFQGPSGFPKEPQAPIVPPTNPQSSTPSSFVSNPKGSGHKLTLVLIIFLIFLVSVLGYFYFVNNQNSSAPTPVAQSPTAAPLPTFTPIPTPTPEEVRDISVESPETDLQSIETDLKSL